MFYFHRVSLVVLIYIWFYLFAFQSVNVKTYVSRCKVWTPPLSPPVRYSVLHNGNHTAQKKKCLHSESCLWPQRLLLSHVSSLDLGSDGDPPPASTHPELRRNTDTKPSSRPEPPGDFRDPGEEWDFARGAWGQELEQNQFSLCCWFPQWRRWPSQTAAPARTRLCVDQPARRSLQRVLWRTGSFCGSCRRSSQHETCLMTLLGSRGTCCQSYLILHSGPISDKLPSSGFSVSKSERQTKDFRSLFLVNERLKQVSSMSSEQYFFLLNITCSTSRVLAPVRSRGTFLSPRSELC